MQKDIMYMHITMYGWRVCCGCYKAKTIYIGIFLELRLEASLAQYKYIYNIIDKNALSTSSTC